MSDAVDSTIEEIDFRPLHGKRVFLDTQYLTSSRSVTGVQNSTLGSQGIVNADYVVSSLRQQLLAAGCMVENQVDKADIVAEIRIGALGTDSHSIAYGMPATKGLSSAASLVPGGGFIPSIPELSLARRELTRGSAKIAIFAYTNDTHEAIWQSGIQKATSEAKDTWVLGVGPFQQGTIYDKAQFAGGELFAGGENSEDAMLLADRKKIPYRDGYLFPKALSEAADEELVGTTAQIADDASQSEDPVVTASAESKPKSSP